MMRRLLRFIAAALAIPSAGLLVACGGGGVAEIPDSAETIIGERLFRETRFSQFFATHLGGQDVNTPLNVSDPVTDEIAKADGDPLPGPYAGLSMNCAACHLVDELSGEPSGGSRTYTDFARRSPIPEREDGKTVTPRNSPPLVNSALDRNVSTFFHFDGEFATLEDLVAGTLKGRNFGWLPGEGAQSVAHVARVIREDSGNDANAEDHEGGSYADVFAARGNILPAGILLKPEFRIDVETASDEEIFDAVCRVIAQYVRELLFTQDLVTSEFDGSPYDKFLAKNGLPRVPDAGESNLDYARRLLSLIDGLSSPKWVDASDGQFGIHVQAFRFGPTELLGMRVFFTEPPFAPVAVKLPTGGVGSCIVCHAPPSFTDFRFHNVGTAQEELDEIHGDGSFGALFVPSLATRLASPDLYLPATEAHPDGLGPFLSVPTIDDPGLTDLGLWNVFANADVPTPQAALRAGILEQLDLPDSTTDDDLLPRTIAWFKTPGLRDLGQSAPYFHTGRKDAIEDVIRHYAQFSDLARGGSVRNAAPEISGIFLSDADLAPLAAFLRSLNEDYE